MFKFKKNMLFVLTVVVITFLLNFLSAQVLAENTITVNTSDETSEISSDLYGIFFEDINHAVDGGLYAELVYNRAFEHEDNLEAWTVEKEGNDIETGIKDNNPLNKNNPHYFQVDFNSEGDRVELINSGHGGISVEKGKKYDFSIYLNSSEFESDLKVSLIDNNGENLGTEEIEIDSSNSEWEEYTTELTAEKDVKEGELVISLTGPGKINLAFVSLFPEETWKGRKNGLRPDLMEKLEELDPEFLRFPGGCVVGGPDLENAYRWKDTVGDITERPTKENIWGYHQSLGIGYYEYFLMAEDLDAEPVPILNAGMSDIIIPEEPEIVPMEDMEEWVQDALDLIEYANGDTDTEWGARRAEHGHPEPFNLKYLGVGNEHWGEDYFERFEMFEEAINEEYPEIELILSGGTQPDDQVLDDAREFGREMEVDIVEEHMYRPPEWFLTNTDHYQNYGDEGGPKSFAGEYAAHTEDESNNLKAALAEAAFMTGLERNSEQVIMASYAPLFNKAGHSQWTPDLIWFDNNEVYGTPSYYVQQMFSQNQGDVIVDTELETEERDETVIEGQVGLGSWLTRVEFDEIKVSAGDELLLEEDFTGSEINGEIYSGDWNLNDDRLSQNSMTEDNRIYFGKEDWKDYTIEVKARKLSGNEGMLIPFGIQDDENYYWWNLGGWNNTQTAIEKSSEGQKSMVGKGKSLSIETNKWYDLKIDISGNNIKCYLDGELIHDVTVSQPQQLYQVASYDQETGNTILKVVNYSEENQDTTIKFSGEKDITEIERAQILTADNLDAENSFSDPEKVVPREKESENSVIKDGKTSYEFPAHSVTILEFTD